MRAAVTKDTKGTKARREDTALIGNGRDLPRVQGLEKVPRLVDVELRVTRLDAQEESVAAGQRESRDVEYGVIGLRQPVQRQHAEHARQCGDQNRALEGDRYERRPAV